MPCPSTHAPQSALERRGAFTLVELLVVLAVLAILTILLLPAVARTQADSRAFQCLNNNRQLNRAWRMWTDDNQDRLLYSESIDSIGGTTAWVTGILDYNPANQSNWDPSTDIMKSPLWLYCGTNLSIWKCPSDESYVIVNGVAKPRVRSFAMNFYFGNTSGLSPAYRSYKRFSEINDPPPSQLFVFLDRREDAIGYASFIVDMTGYAPRNSTQYRIADYPAFYHDAAASFSYADGRGELHRWQDPRTTPPIQPGSLPPNNVASPGNPDVAWLQARATRPR
jgi:prepilin-type N-terminal cleavage/methylation domain-containing protein